MEKGQLIFVKHSEKDSINNITKWLEAFHIFVAVYSEKSPHKIDSLMTYAQTIQRIAPASIKSSENVYRKPEDQLTNKS